MNSKKELYLELALLINKKLYDDQIINYTIYKKTTDSLLKKISKEK